MKKQKSYLAIFVALLIIGLFISCSDITDEQSLTNLPLFTNEGNAVEGDIEFINLEEQLILATDVFYATYIGPYINYVNRVEYEFQVNTNFKGQTGTNIIYIPAFVYVSDSDADASNSPFIKGNEYLLVLERDRSIYYEHDRYVPWSSDPVIPLDNLSQSRMYGKSASEYSGFQFDDTATVESLSTYIEEKVSNEEAKKAPPYKGALYTESDRLNEIVEISSYICQIKIDELYFEGRTAPSCTYICELVKPIYGEYSEEENKEGIFAVFFADTVKPGEEYILLLNKRSEESQIYELSSKYSVRSIEDYDEIAAILAAQGKG